jgi:hypothetical protein
MQHLFTFAAVCCFSALAFSQPVLTRDNCAPVQGTYYNVEFLDQSQLLPGTAGANVTWDFTAIGSSQSWESTYSYEDASLANFYSFYPDANFVSFRDNDEVFFSITDDSLNYWGYQSGTTYIDFSNPQLMLPFPFTYLDVATDSSSATAALNNDPYTFTTTRTIQADGYGTVIFYNGAALPDVLRVKTTETMIRIQNGDTTHIDWLIHAWYKPGLMDPIIYYKISSTEGGPFTTAYALIRDFSDVLAVTENQQTTSQVYPNPIADKGAISLTAAAGKAVTIRIYNMDGSLAKTQGDFSGESYPLDRADFGPGMYFYSVSDETGMLSNGKIVFL